MLNAYKRIKKRLICPCGGYLEPFYSKSILDAEYWKCDKCNCIYNLVISLRKVKTN